MDKEASMKISLIALPRKALAYREAMNILIKACYLPEYYQEYKIPPLNQTIDEVIGVETF